MRVAPWATTVLPEHAGSSLVSGMKWENEKNPRGELLKGISYAPLPRKTAPVEKVVVVVGACGPLGHHGAP